MRSRVLGATVSTLLALATGCHFAPLGPREPTPMSPPDQHQPEPELEENPLDPGPVVEVTCTPQGNALVETEEVRRCIEDEDCRVVCR